MTGSAVRPAATLIVLGLLGAAHPASAQETPEGRPECPAGVIVNVFTSNQSIYEENGPEDGQSHGWVQRSATWLANRVHIRTRKGLIESELLFRAGDCFDQLLLDRVRAFSQIAVFPCPSGHPPRARPARAKWTYS